MYWNMSNINEYKSSNAAPQEELRSVSDNINVIYTNILSYYIIVGWHTKILKNNIRGIIGDGLGIN